MYMICYTARNLRMVVLSPYVSIFFFLFQVSSYHGNLRVLPIFLMYVICYISQYIFLVKNKCNMHISIIF